MVLPYLDFLTIRRNNTSPIKEIRRLFLTKLILLITNISKLQSRHFINICTDSRGTGRGSLGIRGAQFQNRWSSGNRVDTCRKTDWQTWSQESLLATCANVLTNCYPVPQTRSKNTQRLYPKGHARYAAGSIIVLYSKNDTKHTNILRGPNTEPLYVLDWMLGVSGSCGEEIGSLSLLEDEPQFIGRISHMPCAHFVQSVT